MFLLDDFDFDTVMDETSTDWSSSSEWTTSDDETDSYAATDFNIACESFYIPKKNPSKPLGEDAHFISEDDNTIGVADGVGGWAKKGIDAGKYARRLMFHARVSARNQNQKKGFVNPKKVLSEAFAKTDVEGSSTACVITLRGNYLHCANVGDSKFVVIRDGRVVFRSQVQQKGFNCPYQLGMSRDKPDIAHLYLFRVKDGDFIVAGTDGLFDNVDERKLKAMVKWGDRRNAPLKYLAGKIANFARRQSEDVTACTPFQSEALCAGVDHRGGKYDDITVVVARVYA